MRKFFIAAFTVVCAAVCLSAAVGYAKPNAYAEGRAEIAMELNGGVLMESCADKKLPMASTTKIMTALIIIEDCDLSEVITVPDEAVGVEGSSIYLKRGERISVKDLLYGLMLRSGNDSAAALAIHHSGSVKKFVAEMNARAALLNAKNTHFCNPSGLPDDEHFTTARDLCAIACYAMKNPTFKEVVSTTSYRGDFRNFSNKNKMLYNYEGATGVKTGYTLKAGRCLVSSAKRDNMEVVCVVLNCPDMYVRSAEILDWCFKNYAVKTIAADSAFMCGGAPCRLESDVNLVVKKGKNFTFKVINENENQLKRGDYAGDLLIYCQNDLIFSGKLYSIIDRN